MSEKYLKNLLHCAMACHYNGLTARAMKRGAELDEENIYIAKPFLLPPFLNANFIIHYFFLASQQHKYLYETPIRRWVGM